MGACSDPWDQRWDTDLQLKLIKAQSYPLEALAWEICTLTASAAVNFS